MAMSSTKSSLKVNFYLLSVVEIKREVGSSMKALALHLVPSSGLAVYYVYFQD